MALMRNYTVARIRLAEGTVHMHTLDTGFVQQYIGGRGIGMRLLQEIPADSEPLMILTGPLTDSSLPSAGRYCAVFRSPITGKPVFLTSGSDFGIRLKRMGLDGIVLEGRAPELSCLCIDRETIRILNAAELAGLRTSETLAALKKHHGSSICTLSIGPAGENLVPLASVTCRNHHAFGRSGIGLAMGAKRMKAIVICDDFTDAERTAPCSRCSIVCRHKEKTLRTPSDAPELTALCNEYGLDAIGTVQAISQLRKMPNADAADDSAWVRRISCPVTPLDHLAGQGAEAICRALGELPPAKPQRGTQDDVSHKALSAIADSLGYCLFAAEKQTAEGLAALVNAATNQCCTPEDILKIGEKIYRMGE